MNYPVQQPLIQQLPTYLTSSSNPFGNSFINNACVPQQQQLFTPPPQQMQYSMTQQQAYAIYGQKAVDNVSYADDELIPEKTETKQS
jgi:hypothetical protein